MLVEISRYYSRLPHSINNHSVRIYYWDQYPGGEDNLARFAIDRETDSDPRFFRLYTYTEIKESDPDYGRPQIIQGINVDSSEYWGHGLSWKKAIEKANEVIAKWAEEGE